MIECFILEKEDKIFAYYYSSFIRNTRFFPSCEGELIDYDVSSMRKNLRNNMFRGYSWSHVAKYIEYFRAIDSWQYEYHAQAHIDILHKIENQIRDERRTIR